MFHLYLLLSSLAFFQCVFTYHSRLQQVRRPSSDLDLSQIGPEVSNFAIDRRGRQVSQFEGFDWEEPSWSDGQNKFNRASDRFVGDFNWNGKQKKEDDSFIFEDEFENRYGLKSAERTITEIPPPNFPTGVPFPTSTVEVPGMGTPRTPCEDRCQTTPEYNPVCGDDNMTYFSRSRLICAQKCGKRVSLKHPGACSRRG